MDETTKVKTRFFDFPPEQLPFRLQRGGTLDAVRIAYETYGELNEASDNAILLFHALTGSQHASGYNDAVEGTGALWNAECYTGWWDGFIGPGKALDTSQYFVVCANYLGGCYGSTGPISMNGSGAQYSADFPQITFSDVVDTQVALLDHLGIHTLHAIVGPSVGGMMALSLATRYPQRVKNVISIASTLQVSPLQQILNLEQVLAIESDPNFNGGYYKAGQAPDGGLAFARMISHKAFVSLSDLSNRAEKNRVSDEGMFDWYKMQSSLESYMLHQGKKFVERFDANAYLRIIDAWQKYDLLQESGMANYEALLRRCQHQRFLVFSIDSDVCFYPSDQERMVKMLRDASVPTTWVTLNSNKGHDSLLIEPELYSPHISYQLEHY